MYLKRTDDCKECYACLEFCPLTKDPRIMNCRHCPDAPCKEACKYNAFYEVSPGVWGIDPELCVGCGECAKACPYDAIVIEDGIAKKCTLCGECISHCPFKALKLVETEEEKKEKERILGWKLLETGEDLGIYNPSIQEARVLRDFLKVKRELGEPPDKLLDEFLESLGLCMDEDQKKGILELAEYESRYSVLEPVLERDDVEEISVILEDPIRIFLRDSGWKNTNLAITDQEKLVEIINRMASSLGRRITLQEPRLNANLENARIHAIIPPLAERATLTIRKFRYRPFSPRDLIANGTVSSLALAYLWILMQLDSNLAVVGSTGSGKTTTLNVILSFIPINQRIISIEETPELFIPHPHKIRLIVNPARNVTMADLVEDTFRMRPDKVIVGEVRTKGEIKAWINTMLSGQGKGSLATFHALSTKEAINRLESLGILPYELSALNAIVVQKRWTDFSTGKEIRKVLEISEISWNPNNRISIDPIFKYNFKTGKLELKDLDKSKLLDEASKLLGIKPKRELRKRARFLESSPKSLEDAITAINDYMGVTG